MEREGKEGQGEGREEGREGRVTKRVCCRAAANALPCAQQLLWGSLKNLANFLAFFFGRTPREGSSNCLQLSIV